MSSVLDFSHLHFSVLLDAKIKLSTFCQEINLCHDEDSTKKVWTATAKDGNSDNFHAIVLTIPVPQILQLAGTFQEHLKNLRPSLEEVKYSSRYALALYFSEETQIGFPWTAKYVKDNPCIRFVAVDSTKRGAGLLILMLPPLTQNTQVVKCAYKLLQIFLLLTSC